MTLCLHIRGPFRVTEDGAPIPGLSRRGQAMLAYLSCQPGMRAERGLLADLLWSDRAEAQARASLRQELTTLRHRLPGEAMQADRQAVWLNPERVRVEDGTGDFLLGFDLPSEGFEDWLRGMRAEAAAEAGPEVESAPAQARGAALRGTRPALAVLPFEEIGGQSGDMFADGVVEEITGALGRVREFDVIARQSAFALRGQTEDLPAAAARLGADYVVEGSVRRSGARVRIAVQLVRGSDGHVVWSERFDDRVDDLFDLQDRIAAQVAGQLHPGLRDAEIARAGATPPGDRSAYDLTLTALPEFWAHRKRANARAIALLDRALDRDASYPPALAYKGWALIQQSVYLWSDRPIDEDRAAAMDLAERAARADLTHAATLVAIAATISLASPDLVRSESFLDRALSIDPSNAWGWMRRGWNAVNTDRPEDACAHFERAAALSPLDPFRFNMLLGHAIARRELDQPDRALALLREGLALAPGMVWAKRLLAAMAAEAGEMDAARAAVADLLADQPGLTAANMIERFGPNDVLRRSGSFRASVIAAGLPPG